MSIHPVVPAAPVLTVPRWLKGGALVPILMCVACSGGTVGKAATEATGQKPSAVAASQGRLMCDNDDVSQKAADLARAAVPDSLPFEDRRERRNGFIVAHRWELFDRDHDGRITFDEYLDSEWAGYLAQLPAGDCRVTKRDFLMRFLGDPDGSKSWWKQPYQLTIFTNIYDEVDKSGKGYIFKDDIRERARRSFSFSDKSSAGYLTPAEF
jgi:hypothetical protein